MPAARSSHKSYKLEERFGPVTLAAALLGLALGVIESFLKVVSVLEDHFYISATVLWVLVLALSQHYPVRGFSRLPVQRKWIVAIGTILFLIAVSATYYEHHVRTTYPAEHPSIRLSDLMPTALLVVAQSSVKARASQEPLKLTSFYLNEDLCSFEERREPLFAAGLSVRTFTFNRDVFGAFKSGSCTGVDGDRPLIAAGIVIKRWLVSTDRSGLAEYLTEPDALGRLARERGDLFEKIMPSSAELAAIKQRAPEDYAVIKHWLLNCVGVFQPIFTVDLTNIGQAPMDIIEVQYEIKSVGQVLGEGPGGPVWPEVTFDHTISHTAGVQTFQLKPVINIPAGSTKAFNLRLFTDANEPGLGWYLRVRFVASTGQSVATERFQLYLNPK